MLDLRQFVVLQAIAETGSLAAAARALHFGQPTVAHHLDALERHLRTTLVERTPRGAELTPIGEVFLTHVRTIMERIDVAEREVSDLRDHGLRTLRIGTFSTGGSWLLPPALRKLRQHTEMRVELVEGEPWEIIESLLDGRLHCALLYDLSSGPAFASPDLQIQALLDDPFKLLLSAQHPALAELPVKLSALQQESWIRSRSALEASDRALVAACLAAGFYPHEAMQTDDYGLIYGFTGAGLGVGVVAESALVDRDDVVAAPSSPDLGSRRIYFATPRKNQEPLSAKLGEALAHVVSELGLSVVEEESPT